LASAGVTAIILTIAKFSGPKLAGAIGGIPIVFAISYILLTMGDKSISRQFLVGGIYGAIAKKSPKFQIAFSVANKRLK